MFVSKEEAYHKIEELVNRFAEQIDDYKRVDYNETLTRRDFIDPLFKALGWDIDNSQGFAEAYREVIHEDRVKVGKATRAPDYSFRLGGGKRLFFVEAKKPEVVIKYDTSVSYQIRRYGWSAKLAVSIISDFEEFAVYDCTVKPQSTDHASVARIKYLRFTDYLKEFEFLWNTFSKECVLKGSFDRYIQNDSVKKGTTTVDKAFLASLDVWRTYLATNISFRNKELDEDEINFVVQLTIDRLIFLRIAEDRGIEPYGQLRTSANQKGDIWLNLFYNFRNADEKYNSGLFDLKKDLISASLQVDNKVIKTVVNEMYYPDCPYEFSVFSVEILGSAYEQFLGKVIRIDKAHRAKIEDKPEVRKAGGVYYTPQYIVDYIVKNTLGKLIDGKTPAEIARIKIVDPACGSGSFLIGAYQYLLDHHKKFYTENGSKAGKKESPVTPAGYLTSSEKKRILLNNIFGVDIDVNAVEVTKLSLLLKCLEGETETSIAQQQQLWHERILPTLENNIKSGNSLIDTDFYSSQLDFGEVKKIKPFNWEKGFPEVFKQGGFDVVIGNPPYSLIGSDRKIEQKYFTSGKFELNVYKINTYVLFLEKGLKLLKQDLGVLGFIIPKSLVFNTFFDTTRKILLNKFEISQIIEIREKVFDDAEVGDSILFFCKKKNNPENSLAYYKVNNVYPDFDLLDSYLTSQKILIDEYDGKFFPTGIKIRIATEQLNVLCEVSNGLNPGNVRHILLSTERENSNYKKMVLGRDIHRYCLGWSGTWVNYDPTLKFRIKTTDIKSKPGMTAQEKVDFALRDENIYLGQKIIVRKTADHIVATYDSNEFYYDSLSYGIKLRSLEGDNKYLFFILGILNSKLMNYIHNGLSNNKDKVFAKVLAANLSLLPIPKEIFSKKLQKEKYDGIVMLVDQLLQLNLEKAEAKLQTKLDQIQGKIDYCETRINQLVYQLFELTEEEIKIVEDQNK